MKKAQASVEYILVSAFIIMIIVPMIYFSYYYSNISKKEVISGRVQEIAQNTLDTAEAVYYMGYPARISLKVNMPENVESIIVDESSNEIVFTLKETGQLGYASPIPLAGPFLPSGEDCTPICWSGGEKNILLQAEKNRVNITIS